MPVGDLKVFGSASLNVSAVAHWLSQKICVSNMALAVRGITNLKP